MLKPSLIVLSLVVLALAVAGAVAAPPKPAFPVTVEAANGNVTIRKQPRRIVSLSPTATEDLFAIGAGGQVIAVDDQSDFPASAPRTKLSGYTPSAEAVAGFRPDLVVLSLDANRIVKALAKLRIPVLLQPTAKSFSDAYSQIEQLGLATGHPSAAKGLVARMKERIAALVRSAPRPARRLSVYHEISPDFYAAASKSFIGRVYSLFGLRNIADAADKTGSGFPQLSAEYILAANPDLIVLSDTRCCGQTAAAVAARPGWNQIAAVRNGSIVRIDDSIASRWGPRILNFVRAIASALRTVQR